jgi:hypothetical protein
MNMKNLTIYIILICPILVFGQAKKYDLADLLKQNKIKVVNREIATSTDNASGIHLSAKENDGVAWIEGLEFSNGTIDIDLKGKDFLQHSFIGIAFHGEDLKALDAVYFRPFNFQSTDAVRKIHSVQYVSHPEFPWQVLREKYNGKYEKSIVPPPNPNSWFHVKIVVETPRIKVYVNNSTTACLEVEKLNNRNSGKLGLWVGNTSDGDFANMVITK